MDTSTLRRRVKRGATLREEKKRPEFPVRLGGVDELHAAFRTESRARDSFWSCEQEIRGAGAVAFYTPEVKML
jgi:hypothetical protein